MTVVRVSVALNGEQFESAQDSEHSDSGETLSLGGSGFGYYVIPPLSALGALFQGPTQGGTPVTLVVAAGRARGGDGDGH